MSQIINNLSVTNTNSNKDAQSCTFDILSPSWVFSYKCCEAENGVLRKGGDYGFTLTFGNMGECEGYSYVYDILSVSNDIGGVQLKIMDTCGNCNGYTPYFLGIFYYPAGDYYLYSLFTIDDIYRYNLEIVVCPSYDMFIILYDEDNNTTYLQLEPHTLECLGFLFQVEDLFCDTCPLFATAQGTTERTILKAEDFKLPAKELDAKLKELKVMYSKNFKEMR